ncbi:hypothetical protein DVH05_006475 [Phytophthora capsici]|nr:hypothetical protein DVH05_006475 [Phytophthora capsici]
MPPPSDVFPALFSSLRDRLATASSGSQPKHSAPVAGSAQDMLLASLSSTDQHIQRCLLQEIRHDASANRLQLLRKTRLSVRKARGANRRRRQQLQAVAAAESDTALLDALTHDRNFQFFMTETHHKAAVRLQTLFFECIAEMKKALVRMQDVALSATEESENRRLTISLQVAVVSNSVTAGLRWRHRCFTTLSEIPS